MQHAIESVPPTHPINQTDLCRLLGCGRTTLWRMQATGALPAPDLRIGTRRRAWSAGLLRRTVFSEALVPQDRR